MRFGKKFIVLFTLLLAAAAVMIGTYETEWDTCPVSVKVSFGGAEEVIRCWEDENGEAYLFLPDYAELSQVQLFTNRFCQVFLDGTRIRTGMTCEAIPRNVPLEVTCAYFGNTYRYTLHLVQAGEIPALYIDVPSGSMDYIHAVKGNEEAGNLRLYSADGALAYSGNLDSIKGRGNATWEEDKKPYSLTLHSEADLLGMGKAARWILLANHLDASHMKNKMVYDFADALGMAYSPESEWVNLYLNGVYSGLYLLCERNEVHDQRVALSDSESFLVSKELRSRLVEQNYPFVETENGTALRIHTSTISSEALETIWRRAENAILAEDGMDPETGADWQALIDLDSWAKKYLLEEVFGNYDAGYVSQYYYYDAAVTDGKIFAGPVWDFDNSTGSDYWKAASPNALLGIRPHFVYETQTPLFYALYRKDVFYQRVVELYETAFKPLMEELLDTRLTQYTAAISGAAQANQLRWGTSDLPGEVAEITEYLQVRTAFLEELWSGDTEYCMIQIDGQRKETWTCFAVRKGESFSDLPGFAEVIDTAGYSWFDSQTGEPFDMQQPIYEDVILYRRMKG